MSYPLAWLSTTFDTRERTVELLQPELDDNILSRHDFELATRFLPASHRNWPLTRYINLITQKLYGPYAGVAVTAYGWFLARPRWRMGRLALSNLGAMVAGTMYGQLRQLRAHKQFVDALEDPEGFITAMNHVHHRLGATESLPFTLHPVRTERIEIQRDDGSANLAQGPEMVREDDWDQPQSQSQSAAVNEARPKSRWEEIRAANARNVGHQSSWDVIRQLHERGKLPPPSSRAAVPQSRDVDDRAAEQARFDAILEAERRRGQSHEEREFL
ncbi:hypothetical protein F5I97DRAFT_1831345 [Phlebopus sp. FC_14]|nr:hypothetical protein F5I97DRAFT_1831345 [Phlebopus sp. FC_14]